jgi:transposase
LPGCGWATRARHNWQPDPSTWRTPALGAWKVVVRAQLRRLDCPTHGVIVEQVPFARHRARFTRDFKDLVAWCVTKMDATAVARLWRIAWPTVERHRRPGECDEIDPVRLDNSTTCNLPSLTEATQPSTTVAMSGR